MRAAVSDFRDRSPHLPRGLLRRLSRAPGLAVRTVAAAFLMVMPAAATEMRLLMVEQIGCIYCSLWHAQIGDAYPLTPEGRLAPLSTVQLREPLPEGVTLTRRPVFTPTFVLLVDGVETGRIEGYPGEDFFWGLLGRLIEDATGAPVPEDGKS
jgi:hypothetical protein